MLSYIGAGIDGISRTASHKKNYLQLLLLLWKNLLAECLILRINHIL